jgi:hypothetical protein
MFSKAEFINGFVKYYIEAAEITAFGMSVVFDDYVRTVASNNTRANNEQIMLFYGETRRIRCTSKLIEKVSDILFTKFYDDAQQALMDKYDSDADTDVEKEDDTTNLVVFEL